MKEDHSNTTDSLVTLPEPKRHIDLKEEYFNGTLKERKIFFEAIRDNM